MGNNPCCCNDKEDKEKDSDMMANSRRTSRRALNNDQKGERGQARDTHGDYRHTTNIIATNVGVVYNDDKSKEFVKDLLARKDKVQPPQTIKVKSSVVSMKANEPEVPLKMSEENQQAVHAESQNQIVEEQKLQKVSEMSKPSNSKHEGPPKLALKACKESEKSNKMKKRKSGIKHAKPKLKSNMSSASQKKRKKSNKRASEVKNIVAKKVEESKQEEEPNPSGEYNGVILGGGFAESKEIEEQEFDKYSYKLGIMYEKYTFKEYLGVGIYSDVRKGINNQTHEPVVIKIINKTWLTRDDKTALKTILGLLTTCDHKNVTKVFEYYVDKKYYYIISEYNSGGLLLDYINESSYFDEKMVASIVKQVLIALIYCQGGGKELFHKEIRPENLMIEDPLLDIPSVKINDFGTAVEYKSKDKKGRRNRKLTFTCMYFTPPEILLGAEYNENSDIWSLGLLVLILLTGENPIQGLTNKQTLKNIKTKDLKIAKLVKEGTISQEAGDLLEKMLQRDPSKRISPLDAINDSWVIKFTKTESQESSITDEIKEKVREYWDFYHLKSLCMGSFGQHTLASMEIEALKEEAKNQGKSLEDSCTYEEIFDILCSVKENSKETISHDLDQIYESMGLDTKEDKINFDKFLENINKQKADFCEEALKKRFQSCTLKSDGKINCDKIRALLVEREDSIAANWTQVLKKLELSPSSQVDCETFMKIFKMFRLEED